MALEPQPHEEQDIRIQLDEDKRNDVPAARQPSPAPSAEAANNGQGNTLVDFLKTANHPGICLLHIMFKFSGIFW